MCHEQWALTVIKLLRFFVLIVLNDFFSSLTDSIDFDGHNLLPSVLHLSHGFQCSPSLNCQPYEERLPLTSWWRKSSNMTVGQCSLIFLTHHCYNWHPGSRCGSTCNQLRSKVDEGITRSRLRWSVLTYNPATRFQPPSATVVSAELFSHGTGTLRCLQKEMATYTDLCPCGKT